MSGCLGQVAAQAALRGAGRIGVTGPDGAGKSRFAQALAEVIGLNGTEVLLASVDDFHNPRALRHARGRQSAEGFYRDTTNLAALRAGLLEPLAPGGDRRVITRAFDHRTDMAIEEAPRRVAPGTILILDGIFLIRPELAGCLDLTVYLDVPFAETFRRMALRDGSDPDPLAVASGRYRGGQEIWMAEQSPRARADLVIDNSDFTAPKLVAMDGRAC